MASLKIDFLLQLHFWAYSQILQLSSCYSFFFHPTCCENEIVSIALKSGWDSLWKLDWKKVSYFFEASTNMNGRKHMKNEEYINVKVAVSMNSCFFRDMEAPGKFLPLIESKAL